MTSTEVLARANITAVWHALGGDELRHGRGKAFWRNGDGLNVSVNADKGTWFDHAHNEGGGILRLVQAVRGGTAQDALRWLADSLGVALDEGAEPTAAERRDFAADKRDLQRAKWWRRGWLAAWEQYKHELPLGRYELVRNEDDAALLARYRSIGERFTAEDVRWGREDEQFSAALTECAVGILAEGAGV